ILLAQSSIFQVGVNDPYQFELNMANIEALFRLSRLDDALINLTQVELQYTKIILSTADQKRLYELFVTVLSDLDEMGVPSKDKKQIESDGSDLNDSIKEMFKSCINYGKPLGKDSYKELKALYQAKLLSLPSSKKIGIQKKPCDPE